MPCVCGQKVDRNQDKVQCAKCNDLFHMVCVGVFPADFEYLLSSGNKYYCNNCAVARRRSICTPPPADIREERSTLKIAKTATSTNSSTSSRTNTTANITSQQHLPKPMQNQQVNEAENVTNSNLLSIRHEIAALKSELARATSLISALQSDKHLLVGKTEELRSEIKALHKLHTEEITSAMALLTAEVRELRCRSAHKCVCQNIEVVGDNSSVRALPSPVMALPNEQGNSGTGPLTATSAAPPPTPNADHSFLIVADKNNACAQSISVAGLHTANTVAVDADIHIPPERRNSAACSLSATVPIPASIASVARSVDLIDANKKSYAAAAAAAASASAASVSASAVVNKPSNKRSEQNRSSGDSITANRRTLKRPLFIGSSNNNELSVVHKMKWLHLSSFLNNVTHVDILDYVSKHAGLDKKFLECFMLVKKNTPTDTLKKVSFKLGVSEWCYEKLLSADIWPANVKVRPFRFFPKGDITQLDP